MQVNTVTKVANDINQNLTTYSTALSAAISESSSVILDAARATQADYERFGRQLYAIARDYAQGLMTLADGNGNAAERATLIETSQQLSNGIDNINANGAAAYALAGENAAKAAREATRLGLANIGGAAIDLTKLTIDVVNAAESGNWDEVGGTSAGIGAATLGGVAGAAIVAAAAAFFGVAGAPVAVATFVVAGGLAFAGDRLGSSIFSLFKEQLSDSISTLFAAASIYVAPVRRDPLVLDLDGDGIETLPINTTTPLMFDLDNSGVKKSVGWIKSDDGFLVMDRNSNGTIDTGAELFGDATPLAGGGHAVDGFAALAQLDTNADGKITSADAQFGNLRVWRDLNQNGLSEANELSTLTALNITSINVAANSHSISVTNGNLITDQGTFTRGDGTTGTAGETANSADVHLATDPFHTTFTTPLPLTPQALTLPDMNGSGQVRSLREAISSNSTLATLVTQFTQATTSADRRALLDNILKEWSATSTMATTFTGAYAGHTLTVNINGTTSGTPAYQAWADRLTIMERFNGRTNQTTTTKAENDAAFDDRRVA